MSPTVRSRRSTARSRRSTRAARASRLRCRSSAAPLRLNSSSVRSRKWFKVASGSSLPSFCGKRVRCRMKWQGAHPPRSLPPWQTSQRRTTIRRSRSWRRKVTGYIKLQVPAGSANPSPPIGPALGQRGLNIMEFCKAFNAKTAAVGEGDADPRHHYRLPGPLLHLRDEAAAGVVFPEAGFWNQVRLGHGRERAPSSARSPRRRSPRSRRRKCLISIARRSRRPAR